MLPLADDPRRAVGKLEHLEDQTDAHDRIEVVDPRRIRLGMKLAYQPNHPLAEELARAEPVLRRLGVRDAAVVHAGSGRGDPPPAVIRLTAGLATDRREAGTPAMPGGARS